MRLSLARELSFSLALMPLGVLAQTTGVHAASACSPQDITKLVPSLATMPCDSHRLAAR